MSTQPTCAVCGDPMPKGEEMFKFHGYSGDCPKPPLPKEKRLNGVQLIAEERKRQISEEGYDSTHDDAHDEGEIACAAAAYAIPDHVTKGVIAKTASPRMHFWPWAATGFKPSPDNRIRELVKAGALIVAEIERLQRADIP
jgi:hypothetical protein